MQPGLEDIKKFSQTFYTRGDIAFLCGGIDHPVLTERQRALLLRVITRAKLLQDALHQLLERS